MNIIKNDKGYELLTCTGIVHGWKYKNTNIIYPHGMVGAKLRGGIPICCPWFGPHPDDKLPKHGFLRDTKMNSEVINQGYGETSSANLSLTGYPWTYQAVVEIYQFGMVLSTVLKLKRTDSSGGKSLVNPGFHPYFSSPNGANVKFGDKNILVDGPIQPQLYPLTSGRKIVIQIHKIGEVEMRLNEGFLLQGEPYLIIWSDNKAYTCVEPVMMDPRQYPENGWAMETGDELELGMYLNLEPIK